MDSWFDQAQQEQQEDTSVVKAEKPSREKGFSSQSRPSAGISANTWQVLVLLGALLLVVIAASVVLMRVSGDDKADSATSPATSTVSVDPAGQIAVAGQCELEEGEVRLSVADTTLRGTIAQWQTAYYAEDVETVKQLLAPNSWMQEQDWAAILPEAAPEGSSWCAVMAPVKDDSVDVDLMVSFADGSTQTYQQTVSGTQTESGEWQIVDITTR